MSGRNGGPAFPSAGIPAHDGEGRVLNPWDGYGWMVDPQHGLTLRDYFAAKAPIDLYAAMEAACMGSDIRYCLQVNPYSLLAAHSRLAYQWADAMLAAREPQS